MQRVDGHYAARIAPHTPWRVGACVDVYVRGTHGVHKGAVAAVWVGWGCVQDLNRLWD